MKSPTATWNHLLFFHLNPPVHVHFILLHLQGSLPHRMPCQQIFRRWRDAVRKAAEKCDLANRDSVEKICVHLTHLYDLRIIDLTEWPDFFDDMRTDIEVECGRFGKLVDVLVDTTQQTGSVCVVYSNTFAECCAHHMNGRWFVGQNITALISTRPNLSLPAPTLQQPAVSSATGQRKY